MVDQVIENLSGSSQSSTKGLGVQESESSTVGQDQVESALLQVDNKKKKKKIFNFSIFKKLHFSFKVKTECSSLTSKIMFHVSLKI